MLRLLWLKMNDKTAMFNYIRYILCVVFLWVLAACSDEFGAAAGSDDLNGEKPVEFGFVWPDADTRVTDAPGYERFETNDMIHVLGTFNIKYLNEGSANGYDTGTMVRYGALRYDGKNWMPVDGSTLTWPAVATDGQFKAYYIHGSNGVLTSDKASETYSLSDLTPNADPLTATSEENIPYGHGVKLEFTHLCAYLTLIDLEPMVANVYRFTTDGPKQSQTATERLPFNNAFQISLGQDDDENPTLDFSFIQQQSETINPPVFIESAVSLEDAFDDNNNPITVSKASFFLEPGFYDTFKLLYPATATTNYAYLEYDYNNIPDNVGGVEVTNNPPDLLANHKYTLTITKSPGITINSPTQPDGWDDEGKYYDVDVEEFLRAVYDESNYFCEDKTDGTIQILEKTATGTKLLHNIDFNNFEYFDYIKGTYNWHSGDQSFRPNNMEGSVFDGNYHYIRNLGSPLFRYNYGTIQNLGIRSVNATVVSYEQYNAGADENSNNDDMSRNGALCMWNRANATISNVRLCDGVRLTVYVKCLKEGQDRGQETHNIGGVVGSNTGLIETVSIMGDINLTVSGLTWDGKDYPVDASVLIGGLVGQNAADGKIYEILPLEGTPTITVTNTCEGDLGSYSVGGIVGESSGYIMGVILSKIELNGSGSRGVTSYMGGIAGQLSVSDNQAAELNSCIVGGSAKAGVSEPSGDITSGSYIGGIAGAVLSVPVVDCRALVSVAGAPTASEKVLYATGGAFGRIRDEVNIENITAYGSTLQYPTEEGVGTYTNYYGSFAGIVPNGQTWENNYANKNNLVHTFPGMKHIGMDL